METYSCQTLLIGVDDLDITMDGKLLESMATVLRAELPERHVLDGQYTALNPTARKALELDEGSVEVRDDGVSLYAESAEFLIHTISHLPDTVQWRKGMVRIVTIGRIPLGGDAGIQRRLGAGRLTPDMFGAHGLTSSMAAGTTNLTIHRDDADIRFILGRFDPADFAFGGEFEFAMMWKVEAESREQLTMMFERQAAELEQVLRMLRHG